jgi:hypothetical protein
MESLQKTIGVQASTHMVTPAYRSRGHSPPDHLPDPVPLGLAPCRVPPSAVVPSTAVAAAGPGAHQLLPTGRGSPGPVARPAAAPSPPPGAPQQATHLSTETFLLSPTLLTRACRKSADDEPTGSCFGHKYSPNNPGSPLRFGLQPLPPAPLPARESACASCTKTTSTGRLETSALYPEAIT